MEDHQAGRQWCLPPPLHFVWVWFVQTAKLHLNCSVRLLLAGQLLMRRRQQLAVPSDKVADLPSRSCALSASWCLRWSPRPLRLDHLSPCIPHSRPFFGRGRCPNSRRGSFVLGLDVTRPPRAKDNIFLQKPLLRILISLCHTCTALPDRATYIETVCSVVVILFCGIIGG